MSLAREIASTLKEAERDQGDPVCTWAGTEYDCTVSTLAREVAIDPNGNPVLITLTLTLRRELFLQADGATEGALPASGDPVTYLEQSYTVRVVELPPGSGQVQLLCEDPNSGR